MKPLSVLIVEDEFLVADLIAGLVEEAGHLPAGTAESADEALALMRDHAVDFAILDIRIKGDRDGIQLAGEIRERAPGLPYMFITGSGEAATRARAEATAPVAILQKPFNHRQLAEVLERVAADGCGGGD